MGKSIIEQSPMDLPTAMGWIGIGAGFGVVGTLVALEVMKRKRAAAS